MQEELSEHVVKKDDFKRIKKIAGAGVVFREDHVVAGVVVFSFPELEVLGKVRKKGFSDFPYKPGFFAFCAGSSIISCFKEVERPDLLIFPGRGILHPRKLGLASHLGILFDIPTVACSRTPLTGYFKEPEREKGSFTFIEEKGQKVGAVLRSKEDTKPVFVSPGHRVSCRSAVKIALKCCTKFRLPEPLRQSKILAKSLI